MAAQSLGMLISAAIKDFAAAQSFSFVLVRTSHYDCYCTPLHTITAAVERLCVCALRRVHSEARLVHTARSQALTACTALLPAQQALTATTLLAFPQSCTSENA
eukprot:17935-Heterococcus_DN1.PRE.5